MTEIQPPTARPAEGPDAAAPARRRSWVMLAPLGVFALLAILFFVRLETGGDPTRLGSVLIGSPAPEFSLPPLEGVSVAGAPLPGFATADLKGRVSVVNVWASWCVPCRQEHPFITEISRDPRIRVVGINYKDQPDNARAFLRQLGNPYAAIGVDERGRTAIDWGVYGVPETFVVDAEGVIRHKIVGPLTRERYETELLPALERALTPGAPAP